MKNLKVMAAVTLALQAGHFSQALGGALPMAPPPRTARDVERLEAAQRKRHRRALKHSRTLRGGIHGTQLTRVVVDELVET